VFQSQHQFGDIEPCSFLAEAGFLLKVPKQFSPTLEIRYEVKVRIGLEAELKPD
jgi:hypothetical protein